MNSSLRTDYYTSNILRDVYKEEPHRGGETKDQDSTIRQDWLLRGLDEITVRYGSFPKE